MSLHQLVEVLGIIEGTSFESVDEFIQNVDNVVFSNDHLMKVVHPEKDTTVQQTVESLGVEQVFSVWFDDDEIEAVMSTIVHANEWALISLLPFSTEEKLDITLKNGDLITVKVTDDAIAQQSGSDQLSEFLYNVSIDNVETNETNDGTVKVGRNYSMHFSFKEIGDRQFNTTNPLTYKVPDGIKMVQPNGSFSVTYGQKTYTGNTWTYDEASNTITMNFSDTVTALVAQSPDADITININGQFTGEKTHFDFAQGITKDYTMMRASKGGF